MPQIPETVLLPSGATIDFTEQASVRVGPGIGRVRHTFQENTVAARVKHPKMDDPIIVVFPPGYRPNFDLRGALVSAAFAAGMAYERGVNAIEVNGTFER